VGAATMGQIDSHPFAAQGGFFPDPGKCRSLLTLLNFFWPSSLETRVQLPMCHSAAIHFHDLVVSEGNRRTSAALSRFRLPRSTSSAAAFRLVSLLARAPVTAAPHLCQ
jgi:hypothetical protein